MPTPRQEIAKYASQSQLSNIFTDYMGILNAKIYGAVGDGVTSDSSNLQLAVNAANDSSSFAIFLPQGSYSCTGLSSDTNIIWWGDNASFTGGYTGTVNQLGAWADKTYRIGHTYTIGGAIATASTDVDYINPFFVSLATGQTASISKCRHVLQLGTNATVKLQKNSSDMTGFTGIAVTTDVASSTAAAVSLADDDKIALIVTATSGSPSNLSFTVFIDYTQ